MVAWTPRNTIIAAVLLSAVVGGVVGLGVTYALRPAPSTQTRNFYLYATDLGVQGFTSQNSTGTKADYDFSAKTITVNKGDTLIIHFYNPTDESHSFTMGNPYPNDVVLPPKTATKISTANVTIVASQAGIFPSIANTTNPQWPAT